MNNANSHLAEARHVDEQVGRKRRDPVVTHIPVLIVSASNNSIST